MPAPVLRLFIVLGLFAALTIFIISSIVSLIFGGGWTVVGGVALGLVAAIGFFVYRFWRRFRNMTQGGDPSLKRRGTEMVGRVSAVQRMPLPARAQGGPPQSLYAVRLRAETKGGPDVLAAGFRTLDAMQAPPQIGDEVTIHVDPKRPSNVFIDWATLTSGGRRAPGSVTIEGEILARRDDEAAARGRDLRPANDL